MPRSSREKIVPGTFVHLISRLVDGRFIFDDEARSEYLTRLGRALASADWVLISYALMSSHLHLGLIAGVMRLSQWLQPAHVSMAQWINRRSRAVAPKTLGHVFADRPTTECYEVSDSGFLIAYHHNNPVSAGVVADPLESDWTSHRGYLGLDVPPPYLDVARGLDLSGCSADDVGRQEFNRFVNSLRVQDLSSRTAPTPLAPLLEDPTPPITSPTIGAPPPPARVVQAAAATLRVPLGEVYSRGRQSSVIAVRRLATVAWWRLGGQGLQMASELGISPSAVSRLRQRAEGLPDESVEAVITRAMSAA